MPPKGSGTGSVRLMSGIPASFVVLLLLACTAVASAGTVIRQWALDAYASSQRGAGP